MNEIITIVSELPRSGTSLMMQILDHGGMTTVKDNIRKADEDNPKGYYDFEKIKKSKTLPGAKIQGVKHSKWFQCCCLTLLHRKNIKLYS